MRKRSDFIVLIVVTLLFSYAIAIGTTFNGVLTAEFHNLTLGIIGATMFGWLLVHWRRGWVWHQTPLDKVFIIWVAAFGLSLVANAGSWRVIFIGLWYVAAYMGVWYLLCDIIGNGIRRETIVDGLLICGIVVLIFGYIQAREWFLYTLPSIASGLVPFNLPRPVSTLGNPNALANFLVVLIPFALGRAVSARQGIARTAMAIYAVLAMGLLILTFSRGGWIGIAAGIAVWFVLVLAQHNLLSLSGLRAWWSARGGLARGMAVVISGVVLVAALATLFLFLRSFQFSGRSTDLRTGIWNDAVTLFSEKPLTGSGLFTFGRGLSRLYSTPPNTPHSHAHNAILHIAAELGIPGLIALAATLIMMAWAARKNWREMDNRQRSTLAAAVGAVVAFAVHELTDIPATTPAVTLAGLLALALMMMPVNPVPLTSTFRRLGHPVAMAGLWIVLLVTGWWSSQIYNQYVRVIYFGLQTSLSDQNYRAAAEQMQTVIDADPVNIYKKEQGLLWGLAADQGDTEAVEEGIAVYQRFIEVDPDYAVVWANMAALYWQLGDQQQGLEAMRRAVELSPLSWQLQVNLGNYEAAMGNDDAAGQAYNEAVRLYPDIILMPGLEHLADRQQVITADRPLSVGAQVVMLLEDGQVEQAKTLWAETPPPGSASKYVIDAVLALAEGDRVGAETALGQAEGVAVGRLDRAWVQIGRARLARFEGDDARAEEQLVAARQSLTRVVLDGDYIDGLSIAYAHFLRLGFPRQFIPQVYYPIDDPVQLYVLETT